MGCGEQYGRGSSLMIKSRELLSASDANVMRQETGRGETWLLQGRKPCRLRESYYHHPNLAHSTSLAVHIRSGVSAHMENCTGSQCGGVHRLCMSAFVVIKAICTRAEIGAKGTTISPYREFWCFIASTRYSVRSISSLFILGFRRLPDIQRGVQG